MSFGGAQKLLLEHAQWLAQHGYRVQAAFFYDSANFQEQWRKTYDFPIHTLSRYNKQANWLLRSAQLLSGTRNLWRILRAQRFDAIVTFTHDSNLLGAPLAWLTGVPVRLGTHLGEIRGMPRWREALHTLFVNTGMISALAASSSRTRQNAISVGVQPQRIHVIYNSISPFEVNRARRGAVRAQIGIRDDEALALAVGRLTPEKGHELFVDAMSIVAQSNQRVVAAICGGGILQEALERQIVRLNLQTRVKLLGQWEDVYELLAAADIFALPSRWEGLPIALLEGMMAGLPVVATRVEGVEEVVEEGAQGFLVPTQDAAAFAEALLALANDPQKRAAMGKSARARAVNFYTTERMSREYLALIQRLTKGNEK